MSNPKANRLTPVVPASTKVPIRTLAASQAAVTVVIKPQGQDVSHETILEIEKKTRETYNISEKLCNITSVLALQEFGNPMDVFKRINNFALRSSDIPTSGESCVSRDDTAPVVIKLICQQRPDNVFF
jgi:hypothetical protein